MGMDARNAGPLVRNSGPSFFGPVRWSGIPDRLKLVLSGGPEYFWSAPGIHGPWAKTDYFRTYRFGSGPRTRPEI